MSTPLFDFRSDTVTRPSPGMYEAMVSAPVDDDVYGEDPTVQAFETRIAEMAGKEAALFATSGTQTNLLGIMAHCGRGEEYIAGNKAHCYAWEAGGAGVLGSVVASPVPHQADGSLALADIEAAIKPDDYHFAVTRLLCLENTHGGAVLSLDYMREATDLARKHGLATQLDGARVFNACVALGVPLKEVAQYFDTVSICLSKGLGTPVGSVLVGSHEQVASARRMRKMLGGGWRQAGVLAAAGLYALDHNVERMADDHARAKRLSAAFNKHDGLVANAPDTNIFFLDIAPELAEAFHQHLRESGVQVSSVYTPSQLRWVTHLDVDDAAIDHVISVTDDFFAMVA